MRTRDRELIEQNRLFAGMDLTGMDYLLESCKVRHLAPGEKLLQPDVPNHHLFLILEGELRVQLVGKETLEHISLGAGECTGELSLADGKNPSALVVAAKPTRVLAVPHDTMWSLIDQSHAAARNLLAIIAGRMRHDDSALVTSHHKRAQFERQATVDALTGVHNRRWMNESFPRMLHRCALDHAPSAVMIIDIDHFKRVNDSYGHLVGDAALRALATILLLNLRPHDLLARYGGEEFAVMLPNAEVDEARSVAERLRAVVADNEIRHGDLEFRITVSIGVAPIRQEGRLEDFLAEADRALYRAKKAGRNCVEIAV
jgi:diguanylate cyclase (GGDEF)-like protein